MSYGERKETYRVECKHEGHLYNQGIEFCQLGHDVTKCSECKWKEPEEHEVIVTWASAEE